MRGTAPPSQQIRRSRVANFPIVRTSGTSRRFGTPPSSRTVASLLVFFLCKNVITPGPGCGFGPTPALAIFGPRDPDLPPLPAKTERLTILVALPFTSVRIWRLESGFGMRVALEVLKDIINRDADLLPRHRLQLVYVDTMCNKATGKDGKEGGRWAGDFSAKHHCWLHHSSPSCTKPTVGLVQLGEEWCLGGGETLVLFPWCGGRGIVTSGVIKVHLAASQKCRRTSSCRPV